MKVLYKRRNDSAIVYENAGMELLKGGGIHIFALDEYELLVHANSDHWEYAIVYNEEN